MTYSTKIQMCINILKIYNNIAIHIFFNIISTVMLRKVSLCQCTQHSPTPHLTVLLYTCNYYKYINFFIHTY